MTNKLLNDDKNLRVRPMVKIEHRTMHFGSRKLGVFIIVGFN